MKANYNGLWKILIDKNMNKKRQDLHLLRFRKWEKESLSQWRFSIGLDKL